VRCHEPDEKFTSGSVRNPGARFARPPRQIGGRDGSAMTVRAPQAMHEVADRRERMLVDSANVHGGRLG
jgi:hypothetical protein